MSTFTIFLQDRAKVTKMYQASSIAFHTFYLVIDKAAKYQLQARDILRKILQIFHIDTAFLFQQPQNMAVLSTVGKNSQSLKFTSIRLIRSSSHLPKYHFR